MTQKRTCLDCGFLTIQGYELSQPERVMLGTGGRSAVMPANPERTRCFKNLWINYDLNYLSDDFHGMMAEIETERNQCIGFVSYEAGFNPEQHLEHQIERRKEGLQWRIAKLGFYGGLIGGGVGAIGGTLLKWMFERVLR